MHLELLHSKTEHTLMSHVILGSEATKNLYYGGKTPSLR